MTNPFMLSEEGSQSKDGIRRREAILYLILLAKDNSKIYRGSKMITESLRES